MSGRRGSALRRAVLTGLVLAVTAACSQQVMPGRATPATPPVPPPSWPAEKIRPSE